MLLLRLAVILVFVMNVRSRKTLLIHQFFLFLSKGIRTALIESPDHECPHCHCQHVAIDQINPNLYLRNHIRRWHERQNQSSYSHSSMPQSTLDQDFESTSANLPTSNEAEEYDPTVVSTSSQQSISAIKAPIVIKMQQRGKSQSPPQPVVSTRPADLTFEDEKGLDSDQVASRSHYFIDSLKAIKIFSISSSQRDVNIIEETSDTYPSSIKSEGKLTALLVFG